MENCAINFNPRVRLEAFALSCSRSGTNPEWPKYPKHDAHPEYLVHRQRGRLCLVQISLSLPQLTEYFGSGNYRVGRLRTADDSVDGDGLEFLRGGDAQARYFKRIKKKTRGNLKSPVSFILMLLYFFTFRSTNSSSHASSLYQGGQKLQSPKRRKFCQSRLLQKNYLRRSLLNAVPLGIVGETADRIRLAHDLLLVVALVIPDDCSPRDCG